MTRYTTPDDRYVTEYDPWPEFRHETSMNPAAIGEFYHRTDWYEVEQ